MAFTTRADFSFLGGILFVGGFVALGLIIASLVFGFTLGVIFAVAMVGLATTSNILHYHRTDQYAAASLFAAVALMFYYVL